MKLKTIVIVLAVLLCSTARADAAGTETVEQIAYDAAQGIYSLVPEPTVGSVGGEWAVICLSGSDYKVGDSYFDTYYANVEQYVRDVGGVLHSRKYTEYSRVVLALTAMGKNPANVGGYNLLEPLGDYDKTVWQGINGPIWALIALDSGNYEMPQNPMAQTQATREMYIDKILDSQLTDGGWVLGAKDKSDSADPDMTAMALCALSGYTHLEPVSKAVELGVACLSKMQQPDGGFVSMGVANAESCAQVIVALCELGINTDDAAFVKNGNSIVDALLEFYDGKGGFRHTDDSGVNQMATEQALYALTALLEADGTETVVPDNEIGIFEPEAVISPEVVRLLNSLMDIDDLMWRMNK